MDRETIVAAALALLDEVGLDGLTTRRLAAELDVKSPALYWHFRNKQELVDEMARAIQTSGHLRAPASRGATGWPDARGNDARCCSPTEREHASSQAPRRDPRSP